jgi:hypothetical protein
MNIYQEANFTTKLNQVKHEFEIYLDSSSGESDNPAYKYPINPNSIVNLTIEDSLVDWIVRGHMSFFYTPETAEAQKILETQRTLENSARQLGLINPLGGTRRPFYPFRNDGFDLLRIRIKPILEDSAELRNSTTISDPVHWTLSYLFSVYNIEDIDLPPGAQNQTSSYIKCLKIYFWDSWFQKLDTNLMEYSTGLSPYSNAQQDIQQGQFSNPGVVSTGQILRELITLGLSENSSQEGYSNGSSNVDSRLGVNYDPIKEKDWEEGATKMFFTAPAQTTAFDDIMYVHDKHISNEAFSIAPAQSAPRGGTPGTNFNDFSLLVKDRGPTEYDVGQLTLKPVTSYFNKAGSGASAPGPYQYEHFFVQAYGDNGTGAPTRTSRAPLNNNNSDTVDFKSIKYNTITNYRFVDISAVVNSKEFVSSPVYSYDFKNRIFNVEFEKNSVLTARKFMSEKYIKSLYKKGGDLEKLFLITLNKDKENKDIMPQFSLHGDDPIIRQHAGLHRLLYVGLFQNAAINFRVLGLTNREPGRFIGIDKTEGVEEGDFEDKFYGQWFIIDVKHIIETEMYYNEITAIKIHRWQAPFVNFPGTI